MPLHEDQKAANRACLRTFNTVVKLGLTDGNIALATDLATLQQKVREVPVHEDQKFTLFRETKALKVATVIGTLVDGAGNNIDTATTAALHRGLYVAADPTITDPTMYGNIIWGE